MSKKNFADLQTNPQDVDELLVRSDVLEVLDKLREDADSIRKIIVICIDKDSGVYHSHAGWCSGLELHGLYHIFPNILDAVTGDHLEDDDETT